MRRRSLLLVLVLGMLAAACTQSDLRLTLDDGPNRVGPPEDALDDPDDVVDAALADLEAYWAERLPDLYGVTFEPLRGGYVPYGPGTPIPSCGTEALTYEQVADNALYCPAEDLIAWDRATLIPDLQQRFGSLTVGLVMAHEFAHAVQNRGNVRGATVTLELQADCFAGAWVDDVDERVGTFASGDGALDQAVAGLLELRDTLGVAGYDPAAHGSGFDRVSAFQDGFEHGAEACATYADEPPTVVAIPFGSVNDQMSGGNLPRERLLEPLTLDLESFFSTLVAEQGHRWQRVRDLRLVDPADGPVRCGRTEVPVDELELGSFYCASNRTAYMDGADLVPELEQIGDFAFAGELARLYAFAAQDRLGIDADDAVEEGLHADCLTGVYTAAEFLGQIPNQELQLSPGDVDEIIIAFLAFGGDGEASAFERTAAFRVGFLDGPAACEPILD